MSSYHLILLCVLLLFSHSFCERMRNIDYLALGYDVYRGNPLSSTGGVDPGFQMQKVFTFTYEDQQKSSDGRWDIPDRTTVVRENSCNLNFNSTAISGTQSYSHSLNVYISISLSTWFSSFKASMDYKELQEKTSKYNHLYTASTGECIVYWGRVDSYLPPKLSANFLAAVNTLPENYQSHEYMQLLSNFGTHFVDQVHMGARFACVSRLEQDGWTSLMKRYIKVEGAASFSAFGASAAFDTRSEQEKKMAQEFESVRKDFKMSVIGSKPVEKKGAIEWAQQTIQEPMPVRYHVKVISDLFDARYMSSKDVKKDIRKLRANMETGLKEYCMYLKGQGMLLNCDRPGPDPPFPRLLNGCRFCTTCGDKFPNLVGKYFGNKDFKPFPYYSYSERCGTPFGPQKYTGFNNLCCQNEDSQRTGTCKLCVSCGGDHPADAGTAILMYNRNKQVDVYAYDSGCHGELRLRGAEKPHLCCKKEPICMYCTSCGGEYPEETGVFKVPKKNKLMLQFAGRGTECRGAASGTVEQAELCCKTKGE